MINHKTWSVEMLERNGRTYFIVCADMLECDAHRWFDKYCKLYPNETLRLCNAHHVVKYSWPRDDEEPIHTNGAI